MNALDEKIQEVFGEYAIDKSLGSRLGFSGDDRHIPSYVMDWIVTRHAKQNDSSTTLRQNVANFIQEHLPAKGEKERVKYRLAQGECLVILDAISVTVSLKQPVEYKAAIPCLDEKNVEIDEDIINQNEGLLQGSMWGACKIIYDAVGDRGGIRIIDFRPMQTGRVSLEALLECRKAFTVEEWIDIIIRTIGYEPNSYSEQEKLWMLCRLIPVVHNRINMMELAPPGSGKSYIYNNISRHVWVTASQISPAVLFYNQQSKRPGLLTRYDLLVLDEAQSIRFTNSSEVQAQLKGYLEQGVYSRGDVCATAECGLMLLANIDLKTHSDRRYSNGNPLFLPARSDYIRRLPDTFLESPLLDRFHAIIPGWEIPPFSTEQQAKGYGLKSDYFAEVCHAMRSASNLSQKVRAKLFLSGGKRDCTAVERLACALSKLLLIDVNHPRFDELVIGPAKEMRRHVRTQLNQIDPQGYSAELNIQSSSDVELMTILGKVRHYELTDEIGCGGMARVYKAFDRNNGCVVAVKMVKTQGVELDEAAIRREIDIYERLKSILCPYILLVTDVFRDHDKYVLVTEYADGGSLWDLLGGEMPDEERVHLDNATVKEISLEILEGLICLHENDIVHRDIKPQNILRCDDKWKIADFGISKRTNKPVTSLTFQGAHSAPWAPPEQMEGVPAHPSADIYAFGRMIGFLLSGNRNLTAIYSLPQNWTEIIKPCINNIPDERPDAISLREKIKEIAVLNRSN
jgi:ATP-dependent Lon protease